MNPGDPRQDSVVSFRVLAPVFTEALNKRRGLMQVENRRGLQRSGVGASAHWLAFGDADDSDAVPLRGKGASSSPYAARARTSRGAVSVAKDSGARAEKMILKSGRLTQKRQTMLLTLADELLLTVRG